MYSAATAAGAARPPSQFSQHSAAGHGGFSYPVAEPYAAPRRVENWDNTRSFDYMPPMDAGFRGSRAEPKPPAAANLPPMQEFQRVPKPESLIRFEGFSLRKDTDPPYDENPSWSRVKQFPMIATENELRKVVQEQGKIIDASTLLKNLKSKRQRNEIEKTLAERNRAETNKNVEWLIASVDEERGPLAERQNATETKALHVILRGQAKSLLKPAKDINSVPKGNEVNYASETMPVFQDFQRPGSQKVPPQPTNNGAMFPNDYFARMPFDRKAEGAPKTTQQPPPRANSIPTLPPIILSNEGRPSVEATNRSNQPSFPAAWPPIPKDNARTSVYGSQYPRATHPSDMNVEFTQNGRHDSYNVPALGKQSRDPFLNDLDAGFPPMGHHNSYSKPAPEKISRGAFPPDMDARFPPLGRQNSFGHANPQRNPQNAAHAMRPPPSKPTINNYYSPFIEVVDEAAERDQGRSKPKQNAAKGPKQTPAQQHLPHQAVPIPMHRSRSHELLDESSEELTSGEESEDDDSFQFSGNSVDLSTPISSPRSTAGPIPPLDKNKGKRRSVDFMTELRDQKSSKHDYLRPSKPAATPQTAPPPLPLFETFVSKKTDKKLETKKKEETAGVSSKRLSSSFSDKSSEYDEALTSLRNSMQAVELLEQEYMRKLEQLRMDEVRSLEQKLEGVKQYGRERKKEVDVEGEVEREVSRRLAEEREKEKEREREREREAERERERERARRREKEREKERFTVRRRRSSRSRSKSSDGSSRRLRRRYYFED